MENLSHAFLNRFTVINLDAQLEGVSEKEEKEVIKYIIDFKNEYIKKKIKIIYKIHLIYKNEN